MDKLESIARRLSQLRLATHYGRVQSIRAGLIACARLGDEEVDAGPLLLGELV